jgi:putative addiction module CopG family antidote
MTVHLPEDLELYVKAQVQSGLFASEQEAISEAVRLLRQLKPQKTSCAPLTEQDLERQMMQAGFLSNVPERPADTSTARSFQPVAIPGEPLSETVIRERR